MLADSRPSLPPRLRFLLPSVRDIFFIFLFTSLLAGPLSNRPLADADIGWHIRTGEMILQTRAIPRTDPFSASMRGQPWFDWEWLYELILGVLHQVAGLNAVVWLCSLLVAATFTLLLRLLLDNGTGLLLAIFLTLVALGAAMIHLYARPHIVSWLFSLLWFAALARWERGSAPRRVLWLFAVSMVLWVNMHGGWVFGMAVFGVFVLAAWIERLCTKDAFGAVLASKRAIAVSKAFLWSAVGTLVNPYGWRLHAHVYRYLADRYLMNRIDEFRSPDFHGWAERCFGFLVILLLAGLAVRRREVRVSHLLVASLAIYSGFYSSRNLPVSSMLLALIAGPMVWEVFSALAIRPGVWNFLRTLAGRVTDFAERMGVLEVQLRGHLWAVVVAAAAATFCLQGGWLGSHHLIQAHFDPDRMPVAAVAFLDRQADQHAANGAVFSTDSWSGYLIYRWYPARRVLVDDRHDFYGTDRIREYLILMQGEPAWRTVLEKWQVKTALLPAGAPLGNLLRELPQEWHVVYEDKVAVVFEKKP
jgi:hypothetical protein